MTAPIPVWANLTEMEARVYRNFYGEASIAYQMGDYQRADSLVELAQDVARRCTDEKQAMKEKRSNVRNLLAEIKEAVLAGNEDKADELSDILEDYV